MKKAVGIGIGIVVVVIASAAALTMMGEETDIQPEPTIQNEIEEAPQQKGKFIELNLKEGMNLGEDLP